jgi:hypothetical protein
VRAAVRRATVFGLDVCSDVSLSALAGARAPATGRELAVLVKDRDDGPRWPEDARRMSLERMPGGQLLFGIDVHPQQGYRLYGPRFGEHLLSADGRRLTCLPGSAEPWVWQRFLIAQVLPFAAALRGQAVLHASGVLLDGRAVALLGPSGAGKTSVALAMCRSGADFLADDVLAVERVAGVLTAHPGSPLAGMDRAEAGRCEAAMTAADVVEENGREVLVRMPSGPGPAPLTDVFLLDRRADGPAGPAFETVGEALPLLASSFNLLLRDAPRMRELLEVCSLASGRRVERVSTDSTVDADRLAEAILERLRATS